MPEVAVPSDVLKTSHISSWDGLSSDTMKLAVCVPSVSVTVNPAMEIFTRSSSVMVPVPDGSAKVTVPSLVMLPRMTTKFSKGSATVSLVMGMVMV